MNLNNAHVLSFKNSACIVCDCSDGLLRGKVIYTGKKSDQMSNMLLGNNA